jgi:hypothetical protein
MLNMDLAILGSRVNLSRIRLLVGLFERPNIAGCAPDIPFSEPLRWLPACSKIAGMYTSRRAISS